MPEARVFGPILGAGTQVNEQVGQETVDKGRLGSTVVIAPFERGAEQDITILPSKRSLARKMGGLLDPGEHATPAFASLWGPLTAKHFWDRSRGAGTLIALRVTPTTNNAGQDDRPDSSTIRIWNRESVPKLIGTIDAHNGGNWAGKRKTYLGLISGVPATDFPTANQVQLDSIAAKTFKYDEFRNGLLTLDGLSGTSYRIVNISPTGLVTLEADQDVASDWASAAGSTYGSDSSGAETFNFATVATPWTIAVTTETGGPDTATMTGTKASVGGDGAPTTPVSAGDIVFTYSEDGGVTSVDYTVTFGAEASLAAILATLNAGLPNCSSEDDGGGNVIVYTDQKGTGASITINDAASTTAVVTEVFSLATPTETAGTGDMANHFAVTASEIATALTTAIGLGASLATAAAASGVCTVTTSVAGSGGSVTMTGSLLTLLGFAGGAQAGSDASLNVNLVRLNYNYREKLKACSVEFRDGALRPMTEFGLIVRINGEKVLNYENLSMESGKSNYWVDTINNDPVNDVIVVTDSFSGDRTVASARPANHYGLSSALTTTRLTIADPTYTNLNLHLGGDWVPTLTWGSWGSACKPQRLRVTMTSPTAFTVTTDIGNRTWTGSLGVALDMGDYVGIMTVTTSSGTPAATDYFDIYLKPLEIDECIGGRIFPNVEDASQRNQNFDIIDNGISWVDVSALSDLTDGGTNTAGKEYRIVYAAQMRGGYDGYLAGMTTSDFEQLLDPDTSPLKKLRGRGYGLVKMSAPGVAYLTQALALQQKMKVLAARYNWGTKVEMPYAFHDWDVYYEYDLLDWLTNTFVRGDDADYTSTHFPAFGYIRDPFAETESEARTVLVPLMGMILGEEARIAKQYGGYHKAPAGVSAKLPDVVELPVVGRPENPIQLDEEVLNPGGVNVVKWQSGGNTVILWGDRTLSSSSAFKFYHKRCMLSQYEVDLLEGFDFAIFEINDPEADADVVAAFHDYFLPEFRKRAIRGSSFVGGQNPAAIFKMDAENNTDATRAAGDQIIEVALRLADTTERLRIFIGPMGLVEGTV